MAHSAFYAGKLRLYLQNICGALDAIEAIDSLNEPAVVLALLERLRPLITSIEPAYEVVLKEAEKAGHRD